MWNKKLFYVLNYLKVFKAVPKSNAQTRSPQQNKKGLLTIAPYVKVSIPVRSQRQQSRTFAFQKGSFQYKTEKVNTTIEFCIFELV